MAAIDWAGEATHALIQKHYLGASALALLPPTLRFLYTVQIRGPAKAIEEVGVFLEWLPFFVVAVVLVFIVNLVRKPGVDFDNYRVLIALNEIFPPVEIDAGLMTHGWALGRSWVTFERMKITNRSGNSMSLSFWLQDRLDPPSIDISHDHNGVPHQVPGLPDKLKGQYEKFMTETPVDVPSEKTIKINIGWIVGGKLDQTIKRFRLDDFAVRVRDHVSGSEVVVPVPGVFSSKGPLGS